MVKVKCLNGPALEAYLGARREGSPMPDVEQHLKGCRRCSLLVRVASQPMPPALAADAERVTTLLCKPSPKKVEPGQIWRLALQTGVGRYPIGVVTRGPDMSIDRNSPDVRLSRINFEARLEEIATDDVVVGKSESPVGLRYLIEHWNDRPVSVSMLEKFLGRLGASALKRLQIALADVGPEIPLTPAVLAFRERCIHEASPLSQKSLLKSGRFLEFLETTTIAPPIGKAKPPSAKRGESLEKGGIIFGEFIPIPANELLRGTATPKNESQIFELWRGKLLDDHRKKKLVLPAQPRKTRGGIRFRMLDEERVIVLQILGKQKKILAEVRSQEGVIQLNEKDAANWNQVTGIRFLEAPGMET